jgi:hypothetical protein
LGYTKQNTVEIWPNQSPPSSGTGPKRAKEKLPFEHVFHPEETLPEEAF